MRQHSMVIKIITLVLTVGLIAGCSIPLGSKKLHLSLENNIQSYDPTIEKATVWEVQGMATDVKGVKYYIYTSGDNVIYIHPYKKIVYSRNGDVIGFVDTDRVIRLHNPADGWKDIDLSSVGEIKNPYEGKHLPDFSTYKTPESKAKK